jgi:hypothetical protein
MEIPRRKAKSAPVLSPYQRDHGGAASSKDAILTRIKLVAAERALPESEIKKVIGRLWTGDVISFAKKHRVNMDWLLTGDLKGLLDTVRGCPSRPPVLDPWYEIGLLLKKLGDQKLMPAAVECLRLLLERTGTAS